MAPNEDQYGTHRYAGDQAAETRRAMNRMPDEDRSTTQQIQQSINAQQAAELAPDVRMGDDRVIGDTPNWASYSSQQLYDFATQKNSPTTADDLGRAFNDGGNSLAEAANGLLDAVSRLDGAWTGVAADSAKGALAPLAQAAGVAGQTAQLMGVRMSQQSVAASEVRKLPPPKTFDQQQSLNAMLVGGPLAMQQDLKAQKDAADAVKREQISYLTTYTATMATVDAQTPSFVPPRETITGTSGNGDRMTADRVFISGTGSGVPTTRRSTDGTGTTTTGAPTGNNVTGVNNPNGGQGAGFPGGGGQTQQGGHNAPVPTTASAGYHPTPTTSGPNTFGPSGTPVGTPAGGTGGPSAGAGGFGPGFAGFGGPGGTGGAAPGGTGGNPGATGPRGMGPGGMVPTGAAAGRGAGPGGMGGAPRGKGEDEEDRAHERPSYLVEGDPEGTFGSDALTAPPVIGGE